MGTELSQMIEDSKVVGPKECIADAIIEHGPNDLEKIGKVTQIDPAVIHRMIGTESFQTYFQKRLIQRGFDGIRFQQKVNELAYIIVDELVARVSNKDRRDKMSENKLLNILTMAQKAVRYRAQAETLLNENAKSRRVQDPDDVMARLNTTRAGQKFLEQQERKLLRN